VALTARNAGIERDLPPGLIQAMVDPNRLLGVKTRLTTAIWFGWMLILP
jgi:hypothetical protein